MENMTNPSPEELEKLLEKAKREMQAALDKLTPEERAQAEMKAKKMIEEDKASMQELLDSAAAVAGSVPKATPECCPACGAPVSGGRFCAYCGSPLSC